MGANDGRVPGPATPLFQSGNDEDKLVIVLLAEGFQNIEFSEFFNHCHSLQHRLVNEPWFYDAEFNSAINLYYLFVASNESGIDDPTECGGTGAEPATFFDATYCPVGVVDGRAVRKPRRVVGIDIFAVYDVLNEHVPTWDIGLVLCNSRELGGATSPFERPIITLTVHQGWQDSAIHELGHAAFDLLDEYDFFDSCERDGPSAERAPSGPDLMAANVTNVNSREELKWRHLVADDVPIPTMENPDCSTCDRRPNVLDTDLTWLGRLLRSLYDAVRRFIDRFRRIFGGGGRRTRPRFEVDDDDLKVGLFEGANYYRCGYYRPVYRCKMRDQRQPFCPVCLEQINKVLEGYR